jgi:hypothetical protein
VAIQTIDLASGAGGRVRVGLRYDDATMEIVSVGAVNQTSREATVTLLHVPSGVSRSRVIPAGFSGTRALPDRWPVAVANGILSWDDLTAVVSFWGGAD